jgi:hypothetical protein
MHENAFYTWKRRFGGLATQEIRELQLPEENTKLKQVVADPSLDRKMLQEIFSRKLGSPSSSAKRAFPGVILSAASVVEGRRASPTSGAIKTLEDLHVES